MFRKITSNRDPGKTLGSELKKEFGVYFERAGKQGREMMMKYPRQVFAVMIITMLASGVLAFTVMRTHEEPVVKSNTISPGAASGLGQIISTANTLQALWGMRQQVDSLLRKESLSHADSLALNHALGQMDSLRVWIRKSRQIINDKINKP